MTAADELVRIAARTIATGGGLLRVPQVPLPRLVWVDPQAQLDALIAAVTAVTAPPRETRPRPAAPAGRASSPTGGPVAAPPDRPHDAVWAAPDDPAQVLASRASERRKPTRQVRPHQPPSTDDPAPAGGAPEGGTTRERSADIETAPASGPTWDSPMPAGDARTSVPARPTGEPAGAWSRGRLQQLGDVPAWSAVEARRAGPVSAGAPRRAADAPAWAAGAPERASDVSAWTADPASDISAWPSDDPQQASGRSPRDLSALTLPGAPAEGVAGEAAADTDRDASRDMAVAVGEGFEATPDPWTADQGFEATPDPWTADQGFEATPDPWTTGETAGSVMPGGVRAGQEGMVRRPGAAAAEHRPLNRLALGASDLAALAAEIGAEAEAPLLREESESLRSPTVDFDALMNRLVTELELEYVRMYGTGELGR